MVNGNVYVWIYLTPSLQAKCDKRIFQADYIQIFSLFLSGCCTNALSKVNKVGDIHYDDFLFFFSSEQKSTEINK